MSTLPPTSPNQSAGAGRWGEDLAARHLRLRGYSILERNYRRGPGEIDLVVRRWRTIVFVEVKTRDPSALCDPLSAVDPVKVFRTVETGRLYTLKHRLRGCRYRFDIIGIVRRSGGRRPVIMHEKGAYDPTFPEASAGRRRLAAARRRSFWPRKRRKTHGI